MKHNKKSNHHYLSRFYLKHWADHKKKVWVYELNSSKENLLRPNPNPLHIDNVCSEYDLYSIGDDVSIEEWMDRNIENYCAPAFSKAIKRERVDENDIFYIKSFLALTIARHPLLKKSSETIVSSFPQRKRPLNPLAQTLPLRVKVNLIELDQLNLQFLYIPNEIDVSFITSDVPFIIDWGFVKEIIFGGNEIVQPKFNHVWFPISPRVLGFLTKEKNPSTYEEIHDNAHVINVNLRLASFAKDILIACEANVLKSFSNIRKLID